MYALLTDTLKSIKIQEEQFARHGKQTKKRQKPHPKGMRFNPLVIKWSCKIASKCRKRGYEAVRNVLPIPSWETTKQYRQAVSTTEPISIENLKVMVQEMKRRGCKGVGGIHWDEMIIKEGIILCKRSGKQLGFEDKNINVELTLNSEDLKDDEGCSESSCESNNEESSLSSEDNDCEFEASTSHNNSESLVSEKAKLVCHSFYPIWKVISLGL